MVEAPQIDDTARSDASAMMALATELFPICRSITGAGLRKSLAILQRHMPIAIEHVPSGQQVLDWTVPPEWNIRSAYIARLDGTRVVDFADNNLHIVQYSHPLDTVIARPDLLARVHSIPDRPDWIPYRTSYYKADWGFCMSDRARSAMTDAYYRVVIDADLAPGHLSYGELVIPGQTERSVLLSCHVCHPSLANDNLSGIAVASLIGKLQSLGASKQVVGLVVPSGYSFNLDGTSIYLTMATVFIAQATNTPLNGLQQLTLLGVLLLTSKGAAGVTGSGFIVLAATLSSLGTLPVAGLALILGIDRFMSEARALTNVIGNGVATLVVAKWTGELDTTTMQLQLRSTAKEISG